MSVVSWRKYLIKAVKWASAIADLPMGRRKGPRILIYHQVGAGSGLEMDLKFDAFEAQLEWMTRHGEIVDLDEALARAGEPDSERIYVLTFDDGHISLFQHAFPLMHERRIPFTLYVTTAPLESDHLLHGDERMSLSSWDELGLMQQSGLMTVGAHSHRHLDARAHSQSVLQEDMEECNSLLRLRLGVEPLHFAYPWGHRSDVAEPIVKRLYRSAMIGSGPGIDWVTNLYRVPRIPVMRSDASLALFSRKMWGGFRTETRLRSLRDRVTGP